MIGKDPVAAAKVLSDFAKENDQKPAVKGGMLDGKSIDTAQVKQLASLPSREQMLADLGAGLQSPMGAFLGALSGVLSTFAGAIEALRHRRKAPKALNGSQVVCRIQHAPGNIEHLGLT